jgi:hypothetical protein
MPGPEVVVTPSAPAKEAPMAGADGGDLVLGLEGGDAEALELGEVVQDRRGGGDRVGAEHSSRPARLPPASEAPGGGLVAGHVAVHSRPNIHIIRPSVHMFLARRASLVPRPNGSTAPSVSFEMSSLSRR